MLILAAVGDTGYNVLLFLHILAMFAAFAPAFVNPFLDRATRASSSTRQQLFTILSGNSRRIYGSSLVVGGLLGFGVAGLSDKVYKMSEPWLAASLVLWLAMNGVLHAVVIPAERAVGDGHDSANAKLELGGAILTVLYLVVLFLMVFKPGQ